MTRITNQSGLDLSNLETVRDAVKQAQDVGHWRRIAAIFGDHLMACAVRIGDGRPCDCGWDGALK